MLSRFQKAAQADPFAVDNLKVVQPKAASFKQVLQVPAREESNGNAPTIAASQEDFHQGLKREAMSGAPSTTIGGGATTFQAPDWASEPRPGLWYLEVMKDGLGIDQLPLERKATVFGRQAPLCHFVLDHPSVSRQHAALVYHKNGSFYVVDMGSAHGTFVSNERLRKDSPLEIEPGQSVKFAASTRIYMLRKAKLDAETVMPEIRDAGTPPVELPPPPDPSDTEAVVAYHTLVNRHGYNSPLNAERLLEKGPPSDGPSGTLPGRLEATKEADGSSDDRPSKRQRMRSRVSFSDQYGGALAQVVGVSDGADVDRVGPIGVPEGQALTGKYASLVETVIEPLPKRAVVSPRLAPPVSQKLKQYLSMSKGLYGDLPAPSTSEPSDNSARGQETPGKPTSFEPPSHNAPPPRTQVAATFGDDDDIFEDGKASSGLERLRENARTSSWISRPSKP